MLYHRDFTEFGPKYFSFQRQEKIITPVHSSSYLAKINRVSFGVISDSVTNETKIKNLKKKQFPQNKDWRKLTRVKTNNNNTITIIKLLKNVLTCAVFFFLISVC